MSSTLFIGYNNHIQEFMKLREHILATTDTTRSEMDVIIQTFASLAHARYVEYEQDIKELRKEKSSNEIIPNPLHNPNH